MFKKVIFIVLVLVLTLSIVPSFAANEALSFKDVASDYWGKASIDYISSKGYMVGYGDRFGILDNITEGQFLAVLCRIFGYLNQSPLTCEEPARELGLLKENETINVTANLKRGDIAKYTVRAFERLNSNTTYPDYLEAYKGMITDYDNLKEDLKLIALKCVEKGLLAGGSDGSFNPEDESTRAQAAAFIHRILEQSERNKVMPVFANPDQEFEAFMLTPESKKYVSIQYGQPVYRVVDGKIIFNDEDYGQNGLGLLPVSYNRDSNKEAYELVKNLVMYAKDNGHHVRLHLGFIEDYGSLSIKYFENEYYGLRNSTRFGTNFYFSMNLKPYKYSDEQKDYTYYNWHVGMLVKDTTEDWAAVNYREPDMTKAVEISFKSIYGNSLGQKIFNYAISEKDKEMDYWFNQGIEYQNLKIERRADLGGLEFCNQNGGHETQSVYFMTNKK